MSQLVPYQDVEKMAQVAVKSGLFGVKRVEDALALMLVAQAEGIHPMRALRMFDIIQGRPAIKPRALLASLSVRGGRVEWLETSSEAARAIFYGPACPQGVEVSFTAQDAQKAGLLSKPGPWQQYRADMLRHRCVGRGVDMVDPAAAFGLYQTPVVQDIVDGGDAASGNAPNGEAVVVPQDPKVRASAAEATPPSPLFIDGPEITDDMVPILEKSIELEQWKKDDGAPDHESAAQYEDWTCEECGGSVRAYTSKKGVPYSQCSFAHDLFFEAIRRGAGKKEAGEQTKAHYYAVNP